MVNTDDGSISIFNATAGQESRMSRVPTSNKTAASEPVSVVIHPDGKQAFVANRAAGTISRITAIDTVAPQLVSEVAVGAEPMGVALTPAGTKLYATDWVSGTVVVVDTATMQIDQTIAVGGRPFAVAITNNGDANESDEQVLVTQFYARPRAGAQASEGTDDGREGVVQMIPVGASAVSKEITLAPITACFSGIPAGGTAPITSGCFPNQLGSIAIHSAFGKTRAYVTSVAASPSPPISFNHNVQAVISVIDLDAEKEDTALTVNLNGLIAAQQPAPAAGTSNGRLFINVPSGIDFVPRNDVAIGYVTSAGSDLVLRFTHDANGAYTVGAPQAFNIPVGQNPQGLVIKHGSLNAGAFVANLISRDLSIVSFKNQVQASVVASTDRPSDPTTSAFKTWRGKRFFNTSTGIWSKDGWGSCQGCHPMGLTDNVTWKFPAGPRQTISLDGQYASNDPTDMRALNWTAIFDETHDFEGNTRAVSGGKGAIEDAMGNAIKAVMGPPFSAITAEDGSTIENHQGLNGSLKFVTHTQAICANDQTCGDWDLIDAYVQSIRSPRGKAADANLIAQGRAIFQDAGCDKCHSGPKWTVSRTFYQPEQFTGMLPMRTFSANEAFSTMMDASVLRGLPRNVNTDTSLIAGDDSNGGMPAFKRQACNIRNISTFGAVGGADETRDNGGPAQGVKGYNVPSLLAVSVGAPFLHNGAAHDLSDLFDARFDVHTQAGNPNFSPTDSDKAALFAFLESIDESTAPLAVPSGSVLCPQTFMP
jgi:YVTN family beta-propeller protein